MKNSAPLRVTLLFACAWVAGVRGQTPPPPAASAAASPAAPAASLAAKPSDAPDTGFVAIFDGKSLSGWDGDPKYWRVEDGTLVGEITPETVIKRNTFIIWRGGAPADFELKV